ncbi:hypothetical protein ACPW7J_02115 [Ihubacter sp. rT4E-8]|uniref:hypothetical protein n=1 Tax=Ihubacter sp. rT4E-8 TaxID=3242369 RepID=UPI003CEDEECC
MNAKEYLRQIRKIDTMIANKTAEAEHWKAVAQNICTYSEAERVQSSGNKQKMADAVCRYVSIEQDIDNALSDLILTRKEVIASIEQLETSEYDVLHKVYVQYKDFTEIADIMGKSYSWVTTVHGRALANLQKIIKEREKAEHEYTESKEKEEPQTT